MIGDGYWVTSILLTCTYDNKWGAVVEFFDDGFCQDESTEGILRTRYYMNDPALAVMTLINDAKRLGLTFQNDPLPLCVEGDGHHEGVHLPCNWKEILETVASKTGTISAYK